MIVYEYVSFNVFTMKDMYMFVLYVASNDIMSPKHTKFL